MLCRLNRRHTAPACGFCIRKIFQFYFFTNRLAGLRCCWLSAGVRQLKSVKRISAFFSFEDLKRMQEKMNCLKYNGKLDFT